jgi:hypothetical protein
MRDKNLMRVFLGLNVALAACFLGYVVISSNTQPKVSAVSFKPIMAPAISGSSISNEISSVPNIVGQITNTAIPVTNSVPLTNQVNALAIRPQQNVGWEQVDKPEYLAYIESLKLVGCPEDKLRYIILADINELLSKRRVKEAVAHDIQWWRSEPEPSIAGILQEKGRSLEEERARLIAKYLGPESAEEERGEATLWSNVQLTGPVLGSLPTDVHNTVQEICGRSMERSQAAFWGRINDGQSINQVEMAKMRDQTRVDLKKVLQPDAIEEFLLRYSHNAHQLRLALRGFEPTPDEFRKIFRAIDPLDHHLQLEYGGLEALSQEQRERHERQRNAMIQEALGPVRYESFLMTKDPLYRQAQMTALQYGAPPKAILPIYQMTKANEVRKQKILNDTALTPQQKSEALNAVQQEQIRSVQRIVTDAAVTR